MSQAAKSSLLQDGITSFLQRFGGHVRTAPKDIAAPRLTEGTRFPYGPFRLQAHVTRGAEYEIQVSSDVKTWLPIFSAVSATDTIDYIDSEASKFSHRFYRIVAGEDVHSVNVLGYASVTLPPGFCMIANPLNNRTNTVTELLKDLPDGATLNKYDTNLFRLTENVFRNGCWRNPSEKLAPGEGAIIFNPTSDYRSLDFVGDVMQGNLLNPIPSGFSIRSSLVPQPGRIAADLGFPISEGDKIHLFDRDRQKYLIYDYDPEKWASNQPIIGVGESFWVAKTSPGNWVRNFAVPA